jgi:hypothetical protein
MGLLFGIEVPREYPRSQLHYEEFFGPVDGQ